MNRNVLVVVIMAVVVVGVGWLMLRSTAPTGRMTSGTVTPTYGMQASGTPAATSGMGATVLPAMGVLSVNLAEQNDSGISGTATLTEETGKVRVKIDVTGEPAGAKQPAHIHSGSCPMPGAVKYPLTDVVNGGSDTVIAVSWATLVGQQPLAINLHKSASELSNYTACGDVEM